MRILRHRHTLSIVTLLALAMQAILAFAETHTHNYASAGAEVLAKRAITYGMCRTDAQHPCPVPARHDNHSKCPLCSAIGLASAAVLSAPPPIPLINPRLELPPPVRIAAATHSISSVHFQARAPPRA